MLEILQSSPLLLTVTALTIASFWILSVFLKRDHRGKNLPGGSMGFPLIGESISFTRAMSQNRGEEWIAERVAKYGPVFKTSLVGSPTVVILGQAGNKFVLASGEDVIAAQQPRSVAAVAGKYNFFELPKTRAFWCIPINFPGTIFRKGIDARQRIIDTMTPILKKKKEDIIKGIISPKSDAITCLLSAAEENEDPVVKHLEVMNIFITLMMASHDTSACLSTLMIWKLARDQDIYKRIREEHMAILNGRGGGEEQLTWNEIQKMKYTWRVAQELMRVIPMVFCSFRRVVKDTQFAGYDIPKGW